MDSDKGALQLQVQILTEQINAQSDKLKELEMTVNEKNLQLNNAEDLLNRVRKRFKRNNLFNQITFF